MKSLLKISQQKEKSNPFKNVFMAVAFPIVIILLWQIMATKGLINTVLLPAPSKLWEIFTSDLISGKIWRNLSVSFARVIIGFVIGSIIGILLGFLMGMLENVNKLLSSITSFFRAIPVIALVPLFILLCGIGENSKYAVIAYASFWPVLLNTLSGIQNADYKLIEVAYTYGIKRSKIIGRVILPSALPSILTGLRLAVSNAWMSVIAAEMFAASKGIGYLITTAKDTAQVASMYVYVFVIGVIGLVLDKVLIRIQNYYIRSTRGMEG
jgi:sulfonate transport system permease protein